MATFVDAVKDTAGENLQLKKKTAQSISPNNEPGMTVFKIR